MDLTTLHITEYRGNQDIDFSGITSFKVQNHGEAVVEINTIPIYPGKTVKIVEEDGTRCDFKMIAKFTEEGKIPKFRAIYKQFDEGFPVDNLNPVLDYAVTLYNYELGDVVEFSQNIAGSTILTRSFDGGLTFPPENDIDLGFIAANQIIRYDLGGSLDTNAIQFRNNDLAENSEIFIVGVVPYPFNIYDVSGNEGGTNKSGTRNILFTPNKSGQLDIYINTLDDSDLNYLTLNPEIGYSSNGNSNFFRKTSIPYCQKDVPVNVVDVILQGGVWHSLGAYIKVVNNTSNEIVVMDERR